ncbi:bifunctional riboflavin kinase/FAD synthetase [Leucobacter allii]|uniref:bifunctional riboflavin kinase/FAD synthetase n=1 Tax=Leucobacter allii TaxID=2932247 RepID=UPI001FD048A6|nr:bifunctional riboflavin kinase/FAD synthetase [Leucobacter allii]UOR02262.1 bifunctional riboflavin kinase/FAD synthetase [Leucobacter allii]
MHVFGSIGEVPPELVSRGSCVAIGKFDGLHRGHEAVLGALARAARDEDLLSIVLTFANHPLSYLDPRRCPQPLMSREQRLEAFAAAGIDVCVMVEFDAAFASIPAEAFVSDILVDALRARHVIMGADFRFGHRGAGDGALLRALGERLGFGAEVVEWVEDPELGRVSSSRVRAAVLAGDVAEAAQMLGHAVAVRGEVVHGDARGRELGFPTANLGGEVEGLVPADGVYAGIAVIDGAEHIAAVSVGNNPTFTPEGVSRVEAFLLDFDGDLYGRAMEVRFVARLRGMSAFDSMEALVAQMRADVERTRALLG